MARSGIWRVFAVTAMQSWGLLWCFLLCYGCGNGLFDMSVFHGFQDFFVVIASDFAWWIIQLNSDTQEQGCLCFWWSLSFMWGSDFNSPFLHEMIFCYHQKLHGTHPMEPTTPLSVHVVNIKCWWTATQSLPSCHIYSSFSLRYSCKRAILGWAWSTRCFTKVVEKKAMSVKVIQCSSNRMEDLCV